MCIAIFRVIFSSPKMFCISPGRESGGLVPSPPSDRQGGGEGASDQAGRGKIEIALNLENQTNIDIENQYRYRETNYSLVIKGEGKEQATKPEKEK